MERFKNLGQMELPLRKTIEPYLNELLKIHRKNIVSIFLYGSAASHEDYVRKSSHINLLVILERLEFQDLQKSLKLVSKGITKKIAAPLFLTRKHIETSTDVFPIEFLEMKENNLLLYGEELLVSLEVNPANLRLFCEEQIKGKLIRIRQAYLEIGLRKKGLEALLKESLVSLTPVLRNLIRLKGKTPPIKKEEIYNQIGNEFKLETDVFLAVLKDAKNDEKIDVQKIDVFFEIFLAQIQKLAIAVDQL